MTGAGFSLMCARMSSQIHVSSDREATEYPLTDGETSENFQEDPFQSIFCFVCFWKKEKTSRTLIHFH